jgi:hypothetical protein
VNLRILRRPSVWFTLLVLAGVASVEVTASIQGHRKLLASGIEARPGLVGAVLVMRMPPEQYHMSRLQAAGRLAGVEDRKIYFSGITLSELGSLLRERWVLRAMRWEKG